MSPLGETSRLRSSGAIILKPTSPLITNRKQSSCINYTFRVEVSHQEQDANKKEVMGIRYCAYFPEIFQSTHKLKTKRN
jgi:hypothetical protein